MAGRNSKSSKRSPVCEKLLKALGVYPKIVKLGQEEQPKAAGLARSNSRQIHVHEAANINNGAPEMEKKQKPSKVVVGDERKEDVNDVFSDYISRAKRRLGSISSKRHDHSSSRGKENLKEDGRFSDYIIRARNKLKATSSRVGWSKGSSSIK